MTDKRIKDTTPSRLSSKMDQGQRLEAINVIADVMEHMHHVPHHNLKKKTMNNMFKQMSELMSCEDGITCGSQLPNPISSRAFNKLWSQASLNNPDKTVIVEHPVPVNILVTYIVENVLDSQEIIKLLKKYGHCVMVLKDEDKLLNSLGLKSKMPNNWQIGDDIWVRYKEAGVKPVRLKWQNNTKTTCPLW